MHAYRCLGSQKRVQGSLKLGLQVVVTRPMWVLEIEIRSSERAINNLNTESSLQSPAPAPGFKTGSHYPKFQICLVVKAELHF